MKLIPCGGIYKISIGEYYYIGYSIDIFHRWASHYDNLKKNNHSSPLFNKMFNNVSPTDIKFEIIYYKSKTEYRNETKLKGKKLDDSYRRHLLNKEKEYMSHHSINFCLNANNKHFN